MIWLILYFIVGAICGFSYYAYECYKFTKQTYYRTWNSYKSHMDFEGFIFIVLAFWPIAITVGGICFIISFTTKRIRDYFGIE